jgi:hypothetical protein
VTAADAAAAGGAASAESFAIPAALTSAAKSFAVSYALAKLFSRDVNLGQGGTGQTFLANTLSNADPIPVIYGSRRVGASVIELGITATEVQADRLHRIAIWGEGPISAVQALLLDTKAAIDPVLFAPGVVANIEHYTGTDGQAASAALIAYFADASRWNASCTLAGVAYTYFNLVWNPDYFPHGRPVVTADVDGRTLTDPRTGATAFSRNPALAIRDYLTNTRYGRSVPSSMIDDTAFSDAAWHCEDQVAIPDGSGGTALQARYTCDGVLNIDQGALDNLRALLTSCRGFLVFSGGKYKLKIDRGYWGVQSPGVASEHVAALSAASLNFGTGSFSVEGWFRHDDFTFPRSTVPLNKQGSTWNTTPGWGVGQGYQNAGINVFICDGPNLVSATIPYNAGITSSGTLLGTLHHIGVVFDRGAGVARLYIDGVKQTTTLSIATVTGSVNNASNFQVGLSVGWMLDGLADGVRLYGRALSDADVAEHYKGAFRDETSLALRWEFDEGQGTRAYDWSGQGNHGTLANGPTYATQLPGYMLKFVLNADNIIGGWSIQLGGKRNRFNRVRARFFNKDASWQPDYAVWPDASAAAQAATWLAQDAAQVLEQTLDLPFTRNMYTAAQIAQIEAKRSRFGTLVSLTATIAATCLEVGDVVPIAHATPGWPAAGDPAEGKLFRVIEMELLSSDEVRLTLLEYQASVYQLGTPSAVAVSSTSLPDMTLVVAPGAPAVAETLYQTSSSAGFKSRATISWAAASDGFVQAGGHYQLERSPASAGVWTIYPQIPSPGRGVASVSFIIDDVAPATYDFRVAAFNSIGAKSAYSPTTTKEIAGLNTAPSNVANFAVQSYSGQAKFTWDKPSTATDLAVVQAGRIYVRWSPKTSGAAWDNGSLVNPDGYPGDTSIGFGPLMGGTYMAKLWNGRTFSGTEATFVVTEALISGLATLATVTESPAFSGAKSNVAAVDSAIQLDGTTLIDAMLTNIDTWSAIDSLGGVQGSGSYSFAGTLDLGAKQAARLVSTIDSIGFSTDDFVDSRTDLIDNWGMVDGDPIEDAEVQLWVRHTDDDPAGAPVWSAWERLGHVGDYNFRAFQFRLDFATGSPTHNRRVSTLSVAARH